MEPDGSLLTFAVVASHNDHAAASWPSCRFRWCVPWRNGA